MKLDTREFEERMKKSVAVYEDNLAQVRVGKASAAVLQKVTVDYYGSPTPIKDIAHLSSLRLPRLQPELPQG